MQACSHIQVRPEHEHLLDAAEEVLGYRFKKRYLLEAALTHPSAAKHTKNTFNYERLEFLGDSVLGSVIAYDLFERFPDLEEGGLTRIKVSLVSGTTLSKVAEEAGLGDLIIFGDSEWGTKGRGMHSALENVYEACVAALFLDGGIEPVNHWVMSTLIPYVDRSLADIPESPKSSLQELLQAKQLKPEYRIIEEYGPPHDRIFRSAVFQGDKKLGEGEGRSKKQAEAAAAAAALELLKQQDKA